MKWSIIWSHILTYKIYNVVLRLPETTKYILKQLFGPYITSYSYPSFRREISHELLLSVYNIIVSLLHLYQFAQFRVFNSLHFKFPNTLYSSYCTGPFLMCPPYLPSPLSSYVRSSIMDLFYKIFYILLNTIIL